ncbi:MAG: integration host factor subunit beta [Planctomycetaceae bacterium]|nr:integration host factor subunit beta [Planctomycetaceae bacterium]MCB9952100.1 integration host factor subunit beta [Planctomycetaceae bacterium]
MTKKEIVKTISEECNLTQLVTKKVVQMTFEAIIDALVSEGRIELRNFGVFEVKKRAARKARNPRSGEKVHVPEKFVVTFKPGKEMEEQVLSLKAAAAAAAAQGVTAGEAPPVVSAPAASPLSTSPPPAPAAPPLGVQPTPPQVTNPPQQQDEQAPPSSPYSF